MASKAVLPLYMLQGGDHVKIGEITLDIADNNETSVTGNIEPEFGNNLRFLANVGLLNGISFGVVSKPNVEETEEDLYKN